MGNFQNVFKQLRLASAFTQAEMAEKLSISKSTISMYENGKREPDFETLELIADFFNVNIDYLFGRTDKTTLLPESAGRYYTNHKTAEVAQEIFENKELRALFDVQRDMEPDDPQERTYTSEDYWNLPEGQRAELIDGKLYAMAPPNRIHQELLMELSATIHNYIKEKDGSCKVYPAPFAVNLNADDKTWVEPDISVICDKDKLSDRGCKGAPDWIIEIVSPSSIRTDCAIKLFKYRTAKVREYWIVNPMKNIVQTYTFEGEEDANIYSFDDEIPVYIFSGLTVKISDLL